MILFQCLCLSKTRQNLKRLTFQQLVRFETAVCAHGNLNTAWHQRIPPSFTCTNVLFTEKWKGESPYERGIVLTGCGSFELPVLVQRVACITGVSVPQSLRLVGSEIDLFNRCSGWMDTVSATREGWFCTGWSIPEPACCPSGREATAFRRIMSPRA